jgi:hypothetical protein
VRGDGCGWTPLWLRADGCPAGRGSLGNGSADAAERFGQEDDISVIIVTRTAVLEPALV